MGKPNRIKVEYGGMKPALSPEEEEVILRELRPETKTIPKMKIETYEDPILKPYVADALKRCAGLPSYRLGGLNAEERQRFLEMHGIQPNIRMKKEKQRKGWRRLR